MAAPASFGHSGLDALRNSGARTAPADPGGEIARKREAFIAAERARRSEEHGGDGDRGTGWDGGTGGGVSDIASHFRGTARPQRSLWTAYLLWFILGQISAHRFYLGVTRSAFIQLGLFIGSLLLIATAGTNTGPAFVGMGLFAVWIVWILGDVFFIHKLHKAYCRGPDEVGSVFA